MAKELILQQIAEAWQQLNIDFKSGETADLTISQEFLGASWSIGKRKIQYEACLLADEAEQTVFLYELTKEISEGFSFGFRSNGYIQIGRTLYRKVKAVQYGPEGQVYTIKLDLGAIPKAARQAAKDNGWKFKVVLNKKHASYDRD